MLAEAEREMPLQKYRAFSLVCFGIGFRLIMSYLPCVTRKKIPRHVLAEGAHKLAVESPRPRTLVLGCGDDDAACRGGEHAGIEKGKRRTRRPHAHTHMHRRSNGHRVIRKSKKQELRRQDCIEKGEREDRFTGKHSGVRLRTLQRRPQ